MERIYKLTPSAFHHSNLNPLPFAYSAGKMRTENRIPTQSTPENRTMHRHHTARYYVHHVKESLTTRVSKLICTIFLTLLFLVGIISFILWLSLRPHRPRFHIEEFSIPSLGQDSGFQNAQIIYNVTARNANQNIGVYYDSMQVTVYYQDQSIGSSPVLSSFYQEPKNTTIIAGTLRGTSPTPTPTVNSERWQQIMETRAQGGQAVFRLDVVSVIRFKISSWDSKHHKMHADCPVGLGPDGLILPIYKDKRCSVYFS